MFRKIPVPTDGSVWSDTAGLAAVMQARGCGAEIVAMSIAQPRFQPRVAQDVAASLAGREQALAVAMRRAGNIARMAEQAGVPHNPVTSEAFPEHEEIIRVALEHHCDLMFSAAHGQGGFTRLIAGRVPQPALACSPLPVMLYRGGIEPA